MLPGTLCTSAPTTFGLDPVRQRTLLGFARAYVTKARHREHEQSIGDQAEGHSSQQLGP
jgi:hypothetical protein